MTSNRGDSPTRALILGGGGAVGVGWQTGMLTGLREAGIDPSGADTITGTSAGALVGALAAAGRDPADALVALARLGRSLDPTTLAAGNEAFLKTRRQAATEVDPRQAMRTMGRVATTSRTVPEEDYLSLFGVLEDLAWPPAFRCTAIDVESGDLVVWDETSGVPLLPAVASSCAIPALFPTVTIKHRMYMDGGLLSHLNATSAPAADVVAILSCLLLMPQSGRDPGRAMAEATAATEVAQLRETTNVVAIEADFSTLDGAENRMMDPDLARQAIQVGQQQAQRLAPEVRNAWA